VALAVILCGNLLMQYVFFLTTSMPKPDIRDSAPRNQLAVMGFFTSVSTRAAGMNVFDLRALSKANVVVFCVMMYVSSAPMVSMMQSSKQQIVAKYVKGEVLLVYEGGEGDEEEEKAVYKKYLNSHIRWLGLFFLVIATAEERVLSTMPPVNLFDIIFEIMSAYGTSGLSMGAPGKPYSLCGEFNNFSKIILCIVKLMGKHRGLPSNTDAALDGQFHKIFGMLEGLQELGVKQRAAAQSGLGGLQDSVAAAAEGMQRRVALQREGAAGPYEQLEAPDDDDADAAGGGKGAGKVDADLDGFVLRPE
jgi:Trk-type K+ transport system membrane component